MNNYRDNYPNNIEAPQRIYIQYAADITFDYSNGYPDGTEDGWIWESNYIPITHEVNGLEVDRHEWMRIKVGNNGFWTFPMRISANVTNLESIAGEIQDDGVSFDFLIKLGFIDGSSIESNTITIKNGKDGTQIASAAVNASGDLIITYSDGTIVNVGHVKGEDADQIPVPMNDGWILSQSGGLPVWAEPLQLLAGTLTGVSPIEYNFATGEVSHNSDDGNRHIPIGGSSGFILSTDGSGVYSWIDPTELDPTVPAHVKAITALQISNWDDAFTHVSSDGSDHTFIDQDITSGSSPTLDNTNMSGNISVWTNDAGYLTSFSETDPVFTASDAFGISATDISNWDTAFSWGDHSGLYDLTGTASGLIGTHESTYNHTDIGLNTTHRSSNGTDHGYIDQDVTILASPEFGGLTLTGFAGVLQASAGVLSANTDLADGTTATTQSASDNSTKLATTAYVDNAVIPDTDNYVNSMSFNTGDGILTLTRTGALGELTQDLDGRYIDLTTGQSVDGIKTFTSFPVTPSSDPTTDYQVANKKYIDDRIYWTHTGTGLIAIRPITPKGGEDVFQIGLETDLDTDTGFYFKNEDADGRVSVYLRGDGTSSDLRGDGLWLVRAGSTDADIDAIYRGNSRIVTDTKLYIGGGDQIIFEVNGDVDPPSTMSQVLQIENDGTLSSLLTNYETLVTSDDDIPNKKYVDDSIVDTFLGLTDTIASYTTGRILFESALYGVIDSADLTFTSSGGNNILKVDNALRFELNGDNALGVANVLYNADADGSVLFEIAGDATVAGPNKNRLSMARIGSTDANGELRFRGHSYVMGDSRLFIGGGTDLVFMTDGTIDQVDVMKERMTIENDGTIASLVSNYETKVTANNDIPNKKYVDDAISTTGHVALTLGGVANDTTDYTLNLSGQELTVNLATGSTDGAMSAADKTKLDAISGTNTGDEVSASTTVEGIIEIGTQTEINTGTDSTRAVTSDTLEDKTYGTFTGSTIIDNSTLKAALQALETATESAATKLSWSYGAGANSNNVNTTRDLDREGNVPTNLSPFVIPVTSTLKRITAKSNSSGVSWTADVYKNGTSVSTLVVTGDKATSSDLSVSFAAGDEVRLRITSIVGGGVDDPTINTYFIEQ